MKLGQNRLFVALCLLVAFLSVSVMGCSSKTDKPATVEKKVYKLAHSMAADHPRNVTALKFAELVKERTGGKVEIAVYPNGQLGSEVQVNEAVKMGSIDFSAMGPAYANYVPQYAIFGMPFLYASYQEAYASVDGPLGKKMGQLSQDKGFFLLSIWDHGFRHVTNNRQPIEKPEDLKGLKVRTPEEFVNVETFKTLGCSVMAMPFAELYLALQQKVVDGQENPFGNIFYGKLYEVQKYMSLTSHIYTSTPLIANLNTWNKIPKDVQDIMLKAAEESKLSMRKLVQDDENKLLAELKAKGMIVNTPNLAPFREAAKPVYKNLESRIGKDIIDEALKGMAK